MAGSLRLTSVSRPVRFAALVAFVLVMHTLALRWLAEALEGPARLKLMANPMFTRMLEPEAPVVVAKSAPAPKAKKKRTAITAVKPPPAPPAAPPEPAASAPEAVASAPVPLPAASAPVAAASAPQPPASAVINIAADTWPTDTRLSYRLTGWYDGDLTGSASVQWLRQGDRYETRVDLDLGIFGMRFLSQGDVAGESLAPRAYEESRPGRTRIVQLTAENVVLNDGRTVPKPAGAQDTASHFVELSHRFSTGKEPLAVGGHTSVWIARPGGVDLWNYDIVSLDRLQTPRFGIVEAYHLKPRAIKDARGDIYSEIWIAPTLQYLPVRIRITQGTRYVDITVDKIEQR
ncbi:MAG TPA: DUF3108 domain-containing protein [Ramlibacter sp.]|nr:DUF3108 domain-containing protein [Ramlibacter sp.]